MLACEIGSGRRERAVAGTGATRMLISLAPIANEDFEN